jgi:hypothetical protein
VPKHLAQLLTYLFHPILMPSYLLLVLFGFQVSPLFFTSFSLKSFFALVVIIFLYTALFPSAWIMWLHKKKSITDLELSQQKERPRVFLVSSGFYVALAYFFYSKGGLLQPTSFLIALMSIIILGLSFFTLFDKISAHLAAIGGILGILLIFFIKYRETQLLFPILAIINIAGWVGSARLRLMAHSIRQVALGLLWGLTVGILGTIILF